MRTLISSFLIFIFIQSGYPQSGYTKIKISSDIELIKLSDHAYVHISYAALPKFGRFPSNGLIFINDKKAFLFDTPVTDSLTMLLVSWIRDTMNLDLVGFVPNHWHIDCMGGLAYLQKIGIESYANQLTIQIAKSKNLPIPAHGFNDSLLFKLGNKNIDCYYLGAAHTKDNIVVWIPSEKILFCGCMIKEMDAKNPGNMADGDLNEYPKTLEKVLTKFQQAKIVIPGHGAFGGIELIKHTQDLLKR